MGRGSRRQTAKTGDKGIYKKRAQEELAATQRSRHDDQDDVYDEVDRFHNQQEEDFLKLHKDGNGDASSSEDEIDRQDAVMNLAVGGGEESSSNDDDSEEEEPAGRAIDKSDSEEELSSDNDDDDDMEQAKSKNFRNWGRQKKDYYHGDTADLEIGQEEDDAMVEEEAAKEIQSARLQEMGEEDFVMSDDDDDDDDDNDEGNEKSHGKTSTQPKQRDWKKTSRSERAKFLNRQHPELLPLVGRFSKILQDFKQRTNVVTKALLEGEEGTAQVRVFSV